MIHELTDLWQLYPIDPVNTLNNIELNTYCLSPAPVTSHKVRKFPLIISIKDPLGSEVHHPFEVGITQLHMQELAWVLEKHPILRQLPRRYWPLTNFTIVLDSEQLPRRDITSCGVVNGGIKVIAVGEWSIRFVSSSPQSEKVIQLGIWHHISSIQEVS